MDTQTLNEIGVVITRHDGTEYLTENDVDTKYLGHCVLLDNREYPVGGDGYLLASAYSDKEGEAFNAILNLKLTEYGGKGSIVTGSNKRGEMFLGIYN